MWISARDVRDECFYFVFWLEFVGFAASHCEVVSYVIGYEAYGLCVGGRCLSGFGLDLFC